MTVLATPPLPLLVDASVFDGFGWEPSTDLEWRDPDAGFEINTLDPEPLGLAFVLRAPWRAVPMELARLHLGRSYALGDDEMALAPYGIDDATDELFAHRLPARTVFWLAANNLNALFWGLHDWAHFHNHGPFEERAATELQCDTAALAWLWLNRARLPLSEGCWESLRAQVHSAHLALRHAQPPRVATDPAPLADGKRLRALAESLGTP